MPIVADGDILFESDLSTTSHSWGTWTGMTVTSSGGMYVNVASGIAYLGNPYYVLENRSIQIPSGQSNDRIDLVQFSPASGNFYYRRGTAANPPAQPTLGNLEITLAKVDVPANALSVSSNSITDKRRKVVINPQHWGILNVTEGFGVVGPIASPFSSLQVTPSGGLFVHVASGQTTEQAFVQQVLPISTANATYPRLDLVYVDAFTPSGFIQSSFINNNVVSPSGTLDVSVVRVATGIAENEPQLPIPYQRRFYPLSSVVVPPSAINLAQVQDLRLISSERPSDVFGDGSDGNVTIFANTTLTKDMKYNNLIVNNGVTLTTAGYVVRVKRKFTLTGTIDNSGSGINGGAGASVGKGAAAPSTAGNNGNNGLFGGNGGNGNGGALTGGTALRSLLTPWSIGALYNMSPTGAADSIGGASGASFNTNGGGGGGGIVLVCARTIEGTGTASANGQNAAGSGDGGGGGGVVIIITKLNNSTVSMTATAGTGGGNGSPGTVGQTHLFIV